MEIVAVSECHFMLTTTHDMHATRFILNLFSEASGLTTNMDKIEFYPIQCQYTNIQQVLGDDQIISSFPCIYLGLPLHFKKLPKTAVIPLIKRVGNRLSGWKKNLLAYPRREVLVKMVLSAMPTHFLTVYKLLKWAEQEIDRLHRSFLWRGDTPDKVKSGHCLVRWKICTRPKKGGSLDQRFGQIRKGSPAPVAMARMGFPGTHMEEIIKGS
jgi:hypothetical protein